MSEYSKFMGYLGDYYQITPGWTTARTEGGICCSAWAPARPSSLPSRPLWTTQTQPLPPRHKRYFF